MNGLSGGPNGGVDQPELTVSWVVLTLGDRPAEVATSVNSLLSHRPAAAEIVVVGNGTPVDSSGFDGEVRILDLPENVGIPAGRNAGALATSGDIIAFLDDDAVAPTTDTTAEIQRLFDQSPTLAVVAFRIVDPDTGAAQQSHVPTVGGLKAAEARLVTTFLGGAVAIRRRAYFEAGGLPDRFFYAHEETDLSWQLLDRGWDIRYSPEVTVTHPTTTPRRHEMAARLTARNRVWLARRNLPWPLALTYVAVWVTITAVRKSFPVRPFVEGLREGVNEPAGARRPIRWLTAWKMTKLGRPPII